MITVILFPTGNAEAFADTLEVLVPHAVDGFVQEVVLWHDGVDATHKSMADMAGVNLRPRADHELRRVCDQARGDWLLFMECGAQLDDAWVKALVRNAEGTGGPACFRIRFDDGRPWWKRVLAPRRVSGKLAAGFAISKSQAMANGKGKADIDALMRGLSIKVLNAYIRPPTT